MRCNNRQQVHFHCYPAVFCEQEMYGKQERQGASNHTSVTAVGIYVTMRASSLWNYGSVNNWISAKGVEDHLVRLIERHVMGIQFVCRPWWWPPNGTWAPFMSFFHCLRCYVLCDKKRRSWCYGLLSTISSNLGTPILRVTGKANSVLVSSAWELEKSNMHIQTFRWGWSHCPLEISHLRQKTQHPGTPLMCLEGDAVSFRWSMLRHWA